MNMHIYIHIKILNLEKNLMIRVLRNKNFLWRIYKYTFYHIVLWPIKISVISF